MRKDKETANYENKIEYHFNYETFTELFADIKEVFKKIVE